MGSLLMECPLCCNEKFTSRHGLKSHLLEMVEKLACPTCNEQFNDIQDLIEHLDQECQDTASSSSEQASFPASTDVTVVKEEEVDIENLLNKSILAKALLLKNKSGRTEGSMKVVETVVESGAAQLQLQITDPPQQKSGEEDVYYCSTCTINFTSIEKHLEKFHQGDEVFIEDTEDVQNSSELLPRPEEVTEDGTVTVYPEQEDSVPSQIDSDSQEDDADEEGVVIKDFPQILNTVQQQEIFDKDGRLYTRKVVKIEKFWDDEGDKPIPPPIKERYEIVNGKAQKISEKSEPTGSERLLEVYKCKQCDRQFTKLDQYYKHKCGSKTKNFEFKCSKCQITFATARMLCLHMRKHKNESAEEGFAKHGSPFVCETCNTDFPSYKSLRLHKRMHDPVKTRAIEAPVSYGITGGAESKEEREVFMCQICNKAYDKQYEEAHMNFHENGNNFDCNVCNRKFHTKSNLEMHMRAHSNGKKFTCSYCKKGFISYETMQEHILNQCQKRRYECQYCGRRFARPHEKVKHERIHTGEKPHVCQICGKAFRVSYCLTLHMRTHSGTRPYQCPHCNKRFKAHSVYNHHLLTHSDVRAYKCPYCPKAFKTGVQLAGHKNSHIKPFTCNQCNRPFASLYAVRAHMETHKRENNLKYVCWLCGASYARAFALRDHIKEQHPNASEESANCIIPEVEEGQAMLILDGAVIEQMETQ